MEAAIVQHAIEQNVLAAAKEVESQLDDRLHALDNLDADDIEGLRQRRLEQLKQLARKKEDWRKKGHGEYKEVLSEKDFFSEMKGEERMVCHFYRDNWPCKVMDKHLQLLAQGHLETKFIKINAEKAPFLTDKLKIWMLPTLALVKKEKTVDYVVGFDDLGGKDDFSTEALSERLACVGLVNHDAHTDQSAAAAKPQRSVRQSTFSRARGSDDEDSDFE